MIDLKLLGLPASGPSRPFDTSTDGRVTAESNRRVMGLSATIDKASVKNLDAFVGLLPRVIKRVMDAATDHIAQVATSGEFMRPAWGEPQWRRATDDGPLRLGPGRINDYRRKAPFDPGRLSRSLIGERSNVAGDEQIMEYAETDDTITLTYGTRVPYARLHEFGGRSILPWTNPPREVTIPARSYFEPAVERTEPWFAEAMQTAIQELTQYVEGL